MSDKEIFDAVMECRKMHTTRVMMMWMTHRHVNLLFLSRHEVLRAALFINQYVLHVGWRQYLDDYDVKPVMNLSLISHTLECPWRGYDL